MNDWVTWLKNWQELVGSIVTAVVLAGTVGWTLRAERRRRGVEAKALRVALGAEIRQLAGDALNAHDALMRRIRDAEAAGTLIIMTYKELENCVRFPAAVIYPSTAGTLGVLGVHVQAVVFFFAQLAEVGRGISRLKELSPSPKQSVSEADVIMTAGGLLSACKAGVVVITWFKDAPWAEHDAKFAARCTEAIDAFASFKKTETSTGLKATALIRSASKSEDHPIPNAHG
jgi:hypothetical protein